MDNKLMIYSKEDILENEEILYEKDKAYEAYKVDIEDWMIKTGEINHIYNWKFIQENFYFNK